MPLNFILFLWDKYLAKALKIINLNYTIGILNILPMNWHLNRAIYNLYRKSNRICYGRNLIFKYVTTNDFEAR